jgi:hypothetical protein
MGEIKMPEIKNVRLVRVRCIDCGHIESFEVNMVDFEDWKIVIFQ